MNEERRAIHRQSSQSPSFSNKSGSNNGYRREANSSAENRLDEILSSRLNRLQHYLKAVQGAASTSDRQSAGPDRISANHSQQRAMSYLEQQQVSEAYSSVGETKTLPRQPSEKSSQLGAPMPTSSAFKSVLDRLKKHRVESQALSRNFSQDSLQKAGEEVDRQVRNDKKSHLCDVQFPAASDFKLDENGGLTLTLVYVTLYHHRVCKLVLHKAELYIDTIRAHTHLANTLQVRHDVLKQIAQEVARELELAKLPLHFFDKHGQPLHHLDSLLRYAATEQQYEDLPLVFCQDVMLFRATESVTCNQDLARPEKLARQDDSKVPIAVDISKSINFVAVEPES